MPRHPVNYAQLSDEPVGDEDHVGLFRLHISQRGAGGKVIARQPQADKDAVLVHIFDLQGVLGVVGGN